MKRDCRESFSILKEIATAHSREILTTDELSKHAERSGPMRLYCDGRLGVRRFDRSFSIKQEKPYQHRQGNWKNAWPHDVDGDDRREAKVFRARALPQGVCDNLINALKGFGEWAKNEAG